MISLTMNMIYLFNFGSRQARRVNMKVAVIKAYSAQPWYLMLCVPFHNSIHRIAQKQKVYLSVTLYFILNEFFTISTPTLHGGW